MARRFFPKVRNIVKLRKSKYSHKRGQRYKIGRGNRKVFGVF